MKSRFKLIFLILKLYLPLIIIAQDGTIDPTFNIQTGPNSSIKSIAVQQDGKIIVGGFFTKFNGAPTNHLTRLNSDGSKDNSFNIGSGVDGVVINSINIQQDDKIIISGVFSVFDRVPCKNLARLKSDGSLDEDFNTQEATDFSIEKSIIQKDGKIIIGGYFTKYNGISVNRIARLNNSMLDNSFKIGTGFDGIVKDIIIQKDDKILVIGEFKNYNNVQSIGIARLNIDGSLDTSFKTGTDYFSPTSFALQKDGKIIVGGPFTSFNNKINNYLLRLNEYGTLDTTFKSCLDATIVNMTTTATDLYKILIQEDGKIIIGGTFQILDRYDSRMVARLNTDGSLDSTFKSGYNYGSHVFDMAFLDNKLIIGGYFGAYNNVSAPSLLRVNNQNITAIENNILQNENLKIFPNPNNGLFTVNIPKEETFSLINNLGQTMKTLKLNEGANSVEINEAKNGIYYLKSTSNRNLKCKIIISK